MKTGILSILILLCGLSNKRMDTKGFDCSITATQKTYKSGETPEIMVSIKKQHCPGCLFNWKLGCFRGKMEESLLLLLY
jgi:hypothetical protein